MMDSSYWGKNFFSFFVTLLHHIALALQGRYPFSALAEDEVQIIVLSILGVSFAIVGTFLILRKSTMVANAISHTILIGIVASFLLLQLIFGRPLTEVLSINGPLLSLAAFFSSCLTMGLMHLLHKTLRLEKDASIGLAFTSLFALGVMLVTMFTRNSHIGTEIIMGNVDLLHRDDISRGLPLLLVNLLCLVLLFKEYVATSFDPEFAALSRISPRCIEWIIMLQTSATLIASFRSIGALLVLALLVVPPVTARLFTHKIKGLIVISCLLTIAASLVAVAFSRHVLTIYGRPLSTSGLLITLLFLFWFIMALSRQIYHRSALRFQRKISCQTKKKAL